MKEISVTHIDLIKFLSDWHACLNLGMELNRKNANEFIQTWMEDPEGFFIYGEFEGKIEK